MIGVMRQVVEESVKDLGSKVSDLSFRYKYNLREAKCC